MNKESFNAKMTSIEAISNDLVVTPDIPVAIYLQEAEDLFAWCQPDKEALIKTGLDWQLVEDLPDRAAACRYVQSQWQKDYKSMEEAQREWTQKSPAAFAIRDELIHHFYHAFYKIPDLTNKVQKIAEGSSNADMIQDLSDLAALGKANTDLLNKIRLDLNLLDNAVSIAEEMAGLLARANGLRMSDNELKVLRDKAYTYLKMCVDEVRRNGQYVFWHNNDRRKGYASAFARRRAAGAEKTEQKEVVEVKA